MPVPARHLASFQASCLTPARHRSRHRPRARCLIAVARLLRRNRKSLTLTDRPPQHSYSASEESGIVCNSAAGPAFFGLLNPTGLLNLAQKHVLKFARCGIQPRERGRMFGALLLPPHPEQATGLVNYMQTQADGHATTAIA